MQRDCGAFVLYEALLILALGVERGRVVLGLLAAAHGEVGTDEGGAESGNRELSPVSQQSQLPCQLRAGVSHRANPDSFVISAVALPLYLATDGPGSAPSGGAKRAVRSWSEDLR